jgi:hypothetical protein
MNSSVENHELWDALLKAYDEHCALSNISFEVSQLHGLMEGPDARIEHPISEGLRALIGRTKELADAFQNYEREIEELYQDEAWRYAAAAYGIRKGNRIEFDHRGQRFVGEAVELSVRERLMGELSLHVLLLKNDGKTGKRDGYIQVAHDKWRNLDSEPQVAHAHVLRMATVLLVCAFLVSCAKKKDTADSDFLQTPTSFEKTFFSDITPMVDGSAYANAFSSGLWYLRSNKAVRVTAVGGPSVKLPVFIEITPVLDGGAYATSQSSESGPGLWYLQAELAQRVSEVSSLAGSGERPRISDKAFYALYLAERKRRNGSWDNSY